MTKSSFKWRQVMAITLLCSLSSVLSAKTIPSTVTLPDSIGTTGDSVTWVKQLKKYCEGPASDSNGVMFFTEQGGRNSDNWPIWKIDPSNPSDTGEVFLLESSQANGLLFDKDGKLVAAQKGKITRFNADGSVDKVLAQSGNGATFNKANDLSIGTDGSLYFTDLNTDIFYVSPKGELSSVLTNANGPNGIEYIEETKSIFINETKTNLVSRYEQGEKGLLINRTTFISEINIPDGATFDEQGNYYSASFMDGTIYVFNTAGVKIGSIAIHTPTSHDNTMTGIRGNTSNCAFGGPENKTLFITGDGGLFSIKLKIAGRRLPNQTVPSRRILSSPSFLPESFSVFANIGSPVLLFQGNSSTAYKVYDLSNKYIGMYNQSMDGAWNFQSGFFLLKK